jgi:hypothetical protein
MRSPIVLLACAPLLAAPSDFTLRNGLRVRLQADHQRPYLELRLELSWPRGEEPPGREGAASVLARVLQAGGAGPHDPAALARLLEERGIGFEFQPEPGRLTWTLRCPSTLQEEAFALLAHLAARPVITGTLLEAQRARLWREHQALGIAEWAELRFRWELLEDRPEGLASERSLAELDLETLSALHRRLVRPERAVLHIKGDLNLAQARQLAVLHLGVWGPGPQPSLPAVRTANQRTGKAGAVLATAQGPAEATLALLLPKDSRPELAELLVELLPRWLEAAPTEPSTTGQVRWLADGSPCVLLKATAGREADPASLLQALRRWASRLGQRAVDAEELALAAGLRASRQALQGSVNPIHPPAHAEDLSRLLQSWCSSARQRALLTGAAEMPPDHAALKGLGSVVWVRGKD